MRVWVFVLVALTGCPAPKPSGDYIMERADAGPSDHALDIEGDTDGEDGSSVDDRATEPDIGGDESVDAGDGDAADGTELPDGEIGDAETTDVSLDHLPSAGYVDLNIGLVDSREVWFGTASFVEGYSLDTGGSPPFPPVGAPRTQDECRLSAPGETEGIKWGSATSISYWDIGPSFTFSSEHMTHTYERIVENANVMYVYERDWRTTRWSGGSLSLDIAGTTSVPGAGYRNVIDVPANSFAVTFTPGSRPVSFTWTRGMAHEISVYVFDERNGAFCICRVADDGTFDVPFSGCLDGSSSRPLTLVVMMDHYRDVEFNGRRLQIDVRIGSEVVFR